MTTEELKIFDKELEIAIIEWNDTNILTIELSDLFKQLIKHEFDKKNNWFSCVDYRNECESETIIKCLEFIGKFNPYKLKPNGEKYNPRLYFSNIVRGSLHHTIGEIRKYKKKFQNES